LSSWCLLVDGVGESVIICSCYGQLARQSSSLGIRTILISVMGIAVSSERGTRSAQDASSARITPERTHDRGRAPRTDKVRAFPPRDLSFFSFLLFLYLRPLLPPLYAARPVIFTRSISRHSELADDKLIAMRRLANSTIVPRPAAGRRNDLTLVPRQPSRRFTRHFSSGSGALTARGEFAWCVERGPVKFEFQSRSRGIDAKARLLIEPRQVSRGINPVHVICTCMYIYTYIYIYIYI